MNKEQTRVKFIKSKICSVQELKKEKKEMKVVVFPFRYYNIKIEFIE